MFPDRYRQIDDETEIAGLLEDLGRRVTELERLSLSYRILSFLSHLWSRLCGEV